MKELNILQIILIFSVPSLLLHSQERTESRDNRVLQARKEHIYSADQGNGFFKNPVLVGPGSDNTVVRVDSNYFMMAGGGWPDQLIWHSRDLVNWKPLTRALQKWDGHAWASEITYYKNKYYIYTTQVDASRGEDNGLTIPQRSLLGIPERHKGDPAFKNVALFSENPEGPWSDPVNLEVYGLFDPGHVIDRDGNRYLFFNKGMAIPLSSDGITVKDELQITYEGWSYPEHWVVECSCLEAPKLIFHNGYYYMVSAQGGTSGPSTAHMGIVARSKSVLGPWENSPYNPIVHTINQDERWWRQGHGTLIDDIEGNWWILYTGYEKNYTHLGKQSLLLPVEWTKDGWPRVPSGIGPEDLIPMPPGENVGHGMPLSDDFDSPELGIQWNYSPHIKPEEIFQTGSGKLIIKAKGKSLKEASRLSVRIVNHNYEAEVEIILRERAQAGLMLSSGGENSSFVTVGLSKSQTFAGWSRSGIQVPWNSERIFVRFRNLGGDVSFFYSEDGENWRKFENSTYFDKANEISLFASGEGEIIFRNFIYRGLD